MKFILYEGLVEGTLSNVIDSCVKYWIGVLKNDQDRKAMFDYYDELVTAEKAMEESGVSKNKGDEEADTREGATGGNGSDSDEGGTLEYDIDLMEDVDVKRKKKYSKEVKYRRSNEHEMSESDENDAAESQEMKHWNEQQNASDAIEDEADEDDSNKSKGEKKSDKQYTNMSAESGMADEIDGDKTVHEDASITTTEQTVEPDTQSTIDHEGLHSKTQTDIMEKKLDITGPKNDSENKESKAETNALIESKLDTTQTEMGEGMTEPLDNTGQTNDLGKHADITDPENDTETKDNKEQTNDMSGKLDIAQKEDEEPMTDNVKNDDAHHKKMEMDINDT